MGVFDRIHSRIEIWRLERRYTRHRERRSTFVSNAIYVDGEYVYQTPNATGSSYNSNNSGNSSPTTHDSSAFSSSPTPSYAQESMSAKQRKKLNRFSSMPGFGSSGQQNVVAPAPDWRTQRNSFDGAGRAAGALRGKLRSKPRSEGIGNIQNGSTTTSNVVRPHLENKTFDSTRPFSRTISAPRAQNGQRALDVDLEYYPSSYGREVSSWA